jgi:uncharacterized protein
MSSSAPDTSSPEASDVAIQHEEEATKGVYYYAVGDAMAEMTYTKLGDHAIIIDHTEVPEAFKGQGIGLKLVTRAVEDARLSHKKIMPLCPFAAAQFRRHAAEWADVLLK